MSQSFTIGITGGSGSGKTFFIRKLASLFQADQICLFSQDHYYFPKERQVKDDNGIENFDLPGAIDHIAFLADLRNLKSGKIVTRQEYTFNNSESIASEFTLVPSPIILVEGLFVFNQFELEKELDMRIFIEAKDHIKLSRRIHRDRIERGYDIDDVLYRFENHVMPVYETLIEPQREKADFIIPNHKSFDVAVEMIATALRAKISY
jgi:uridine kinase